MHDIQSGAGCSNENRARTVSRRVEALHRASERRRPRGAAAAAERRGQRRRARDQRVAEGGHLRLAPQPCAKGGEALAMRRRVSMSAETRLVRQSRAVAGDQLSSLGADGSNGTRAERRDHRKGNEERVQRSNVHEGSAGERGPRPAADGTARRPQRARGETHRQQRGAKADGANLWRAPSDPSFARSNREQAAAAGDACPDAPP